MKQTCLQSGSVSAGVRFEGLDRFVEDYVNRVIGVDLGCGKIQMADETYHWKIRSSGRGVKQRFFESHIKITIEHKPSHIKKHAYLKLSGPNLNDKKNRSKIDKALQEVILNIFVQIYKPNSSSRV